MIEELKGEVEFAGQLARVATAWAKYHGANNHIDPVYIFLAKHGPALIKAVELAEAALKADLLLNGGLPFAGTPAEDRFFEAVDAYDAAKKEAK